MRTTIISAIALLATFFFAGCKESLVMQPTQRPGVVHWQIDNLESIGGHSVTVIGSPRVIEDGTIRAVSFDGEGDGLYVDGNPFAGSTVFTVEAFFRPEKGGKFEQRFFHVQEDGTTNRMLFETRVVDDAQWYLDTFVLQGQERLVLINPANRHPLQQWYHVAAVWDGETLSHYVNGQLELSGKVNLAPFNKATTSLGMRHNKVSWFRGAIAWIRVTPAVLEPHEFNTAPAK